MTLACAILFPLIFFVVGNLTRRIRAIAAAEAEMEGAYFAIGAEAFEGIKTVKTYKMERKILKRFNASIDVLEDRILSIAKITNATVPLMEFIGGLVIGTFVVYAAWQTVTNGKTPGEFTAFITAFLMAYQPAERLSKIWVEIQKNVVHAQRMFKLLDAKPKLKVTGSETLEGVENTIVFEDVSFAYKGETLAIKHLKATIKSGERVAVVGRSGAGKSTFVDLLLRFFNPTDGVVQIGGTDLTTVSDEAIFNYTALISQDVFLFDGSIRDNIRDGNPQATDEMVETAARRVTHRAATLNYVDRVLLLQDGELLAFDTVENLQNQFENFRSLFNLSAAP